MKRGLIIIIAAALVVSILSKLLTKKSKAKKMFTETDFAEAIRELTTEYNISVLQSVEKIFRLETAHFKSSAFKMTGASGLEISGKNKDAPYGWKTGAEFLTGGKTFLFQMPENKTGIIKTFIGFYDIRDSIRFVATYVKNYRAGRWYSTILADQEKYEKSLAAIKARFV